MCFPRDTIGMVKPYYQGQRQLELISGPVQQPLLCFSSTWFSTFSSFLSSLPLQGEEFSVQSLCRIRAQLDLTNQGPQKHSLKAELQRLIVGCSTGSPRDLVKGGQRMLTWIWDIGRCSLHGTEELQNY